MNPTIPRINNCRLFVLFFTSLSRYRRLCANAKRERERYRCVKDIIHTYVHGGYFAQVKYVRFLCRRTHCRYATPRLNVVLNVTRRCTLILYCFIRIPHSPGCIRLTILPYPWLGLRWDFILKLRAVITWNGTRDPRYNNNHNNNNDYIQPTKVCIFFPPRA